MSTINDISKRHDIYQNDMINDMSQKLFKNNVLFACAQKIGKITTAIHLIADVIDIQNPLAITLRNVSLETLDTCYKMVHQASKNTKESLELLIIDMHYLTSLITTGEISRNISEMNARVITAECIKVIEILNDLVVEKQSRQFIFDMGHPAHAQPEAVINHAILDDNFFDQAYNQLKRNTHIKTTLTTSINDTGQNVVYENNQNDIVNDDTKTKTTSQKKHIKTMLKSSSERRQDIMQVIISHKNATMQDILQYVTDCSEKTLQREIAAMIDAGIILKKGDKRWATYHKNEH